MVFIRTESKLRCSLAVCVGIIVLSMRVLAGDPVATWGFEAGEGEMQFVGEVVPVEGPDRSVSTNLPEKNRAMGFSGDGGHLRVADSDLLRFDRGDAITVEAWLRFDGESSAPYVVGKGRLRAGEENQNWALRLMKVGGNYRVSFLFRSRAGDGHGEAFHRWNSAVGFPSSHLWHHVAVSYRFGEPGSIKAFVDGVKTAGRWDLGGATERAPVVDAAEVWIGSACGGVPGNSWHGAIDQLAIYREILSDDELAGRVDFVGGVATVDWAQVPDDAVQVEIFNGLAKHAWPQRSVLAEPGFTVPALALLDLPPRYANGGSRERRRETLVRLSLRAEIPEGSRQLLLRAPSLARLYIDGEEIAKLGAYDMSSDAHQNMRPKVAATSYPRARLGTRDTIVKFDSDGGRHEIVLEAVVGRGSKRFTLGELLVATGSVEGESWNLLTPGQDSALEFTPLGMEIYRQELAAQLVALADERRARSRAEAALEWGTRHVAAREFMASLPALELQSELVSGEAIDRFLSAKISSAQRAAEKGGPHMDLARGSVAILGDRCFRCHGKKEKGQLRLNSRAAALRRGESDELAIVPGSPDQSEVMRRIRSADEEERMPPKGTRLGAGEISQLERWIAAGAPWPIISGSVSIPPPLDDAAFLRRLYLDTVGIFPSPEEIRAFRADPAEDRVGRRVEALLADPRHADHWTGYWQDVLAENPRLVKGMLNNTGPFRWWINEALRDKLPFDQFVRELVAGGGSDFEGGARGFRVATENDAPSAAKAHILGTAFLGTEMKCARCHDAPYHSSKQKDLFSMAAMLEGKELRVPGSSTVPASFFARLGGRKSLVEVTLPPGELVPPAWPFGEYASVGDDVGPGPPGERLAWQLTRPENRRFAQVVVNRVWKRYFGQGFVEPVSDWEGNEPSHPQLLDYLARDFVANGYDLDRLSKSILTSDAYQREARLEPVSTAQDRLFEAPLRRRLSAEQLVDSLFAATGVPMYSEELTFDLPGTNTASTFQNLGRPTRAWQFVSLASDRDRPSLTLPYADSIVAVMKAFGWRSDRSEPITERNVEPNVMQPGMLANGVFGTWITRLSPYSDLTRLAVEATSPRQLSDELYLRLLGREPLAAERSALVAMLVEGFDRRLLKSAGEFRKKIYVPAVREVTWSNHLSPEANVYAAEIEKQVEQGPPVTDFIDARWGARMEDAVWAIVNSPEMLFIP